jgi:hypothetical protein
MEIQAPFGIVTGCHAGDRHFVQATLASIRHFMPNVPICLVVDGNFDVTDLIELYDVIILRIPDLPSPEMRDLIAGNYRAKLAAMWEGPFDFYVWLDSDAIAWGNFIPQIRTDVDFQILWSEVSIPTDVDQIPEWLPHFYFDPRLLAEFDPDFNWQGNPYFSAGVFACRRSAISYQDWLAVEKWNKQVPGGLFRFGDMGIMNYLVHAGKQSGRLTVVMSDLQQICGHHGTTELEADCRGSGWQFPPEINRPRAVHFCGRKPYLFDRKSYSRPFTIARLEHRRRFQSNLEAWIGIWTEDAKILKSKLMGRLGLANG